MGGSWPLKICRRVRKCFDPTENVTFFHSKLLLDNSASCECSVLSLEVRLKLFYGMLGFLLEQKKALRETQTLRAGCSKAEPKKFAPPQTPFPGAQDGQNLISWRWSLPLPTDQVWWKSMHAISSYRGNRPTNTQIWNTHTHTHTNKQTHRQDPLQYTARR